MNIMVVDDESIVLRGIMEIIRKFGRPDYRIAGASDAFEALERLESFAPDLLITDINMPEMSGLELISRLRESGFTAKIIILTGYGEFEYARQAIQLQVHDYLLKPINKEELQRLLLDVEREVRGRERGAIARREEREPSRLDTLGQIDDYIRHNCHRDLSLDEIAGHVRLHPNYVSAMFKKATGENILSRMHKYRIEAAIEMMKRDPQRPVGEVAGENGFVSVRHFFKVFKKVTGVTPGQYRDNVRSKDQL